MIDAILTVQWTDETRDGRVLTIRRYNDDRWWVSTEGLNAIDFDALPVIAFGTTLVKS